MSEDSLYKLIDELKENGVSAEVSELKGGKNGEIQKSLGISVKLDFSEHDSMLKDEIEKLKSELEYEKRNINYLRTRCMKDATDAFDSRAYGRLTIVGRRVDLEAENEKLKQRIAELESKEIKNPINGWICVVAKEINGQEYVRLEDFMRVVNDFQEKNKLEDDGK